MLGRTPPEAIVTPFRSWGKKTSGLSKENGCRLLFIIVNYRQLKLSCNILM